MGAMQFFGVALVCIGVFALSVIEKKKDDTIRLQSGLAADKKYTRSVLAIVFPLLYCLIDGLGTFADALLLDRAIAETQANIAYELTFLFMAVCAFISVSYTHLDVYKRQVPPSPKRTNSGRSTSWMSSRSPPTVLWPGKTCPTPSIKPSRASSAPSSGKSWSAMKKASLCLSLIHICSWA